MTLWHIDLSPGAEKDLRRIKDRRLHKRLTDGIGELSTDPRPSGCVKLAGRADEWRIRVGDWRIVYRVDDGVLVVLVVTVAPRGGVYR